MCAAFLVLGPKHLLGVGDASGVNALLQSSTLSWSFCGVGVVPIGDDACCRVVIVEPLHGCALVSSC